MKAKLKVVGGRATQGEIEVSLPTVVGRAKEANIRVKHPTVSRRHCELREENGLLVVEDLGSSNGIAVGDRIVRHATLRPGDRVTIGPLTFEAVYELNGTSAAPGPKAASGAAPLADTEVESEFDFLGGDLELAPADAARATAPSEAGPSADDLQLDEEFELAPLDDASLRSAAAPETKEPEANVDAAKLDLDDEQFELPEEIPLAVDDIELVDEAPSAPPNQAAAAGESGLKLHETLEFDLVDELDSPKSEEPAPAMPQKAPASGDDDGLEGLDDWLGLSDK